MPNIKPISDLRNYSEVLGTVVAGEPLFLTKNGRGKFAVLAIEDYEKMQATIKLMSKLSAGETSAKENGWKNLSDLKAIDSLVDDKMKKKEFEIQGCVAVKGNISEDEFWNKFIQFVESNGWLFGGGINEIIDSE